MKENNHMKALPKDMKDKESRNYSNECNCPSLRLIEFCLEMKSFLMSEPVIISWFSSSFSLVFPDHNSAKMKEEKIMPMTTSKNCSKENLSSFN